MKKGRSSGFQPDHELGIQGQDCLFNTSPWPEAQQPMSAAVAQKWGPAVNGGIKG